MKVSRPLTLASGIIEIIVASLFMLAGVIVAIGGIAMADLIATMFEEIIGMTLPSGGFLIAVFAIAGIIVIGLGVMFLIFGIKTCKYKGLTTEEYKSKKGAIITFMVFEFLFGIGMLITSFSAGFNVMSFISALVFLLIPVFKLIDWIREDSKVAGTVKAE